MSSPLDTDAEALSTAQTQTLLVNLTAAITALVSSRTPAVPVTDHYASNDTFDRITPAGDRAFEDISKPLDTIWGGTAQKNASFSSNFAQRADDGGWDRADPHRILNVNGKDVLEDSKFVTKADLVTARIAQINPRAKQNCKALFKCLESSTTPSVKSTIFGQPNNRPTGNNGVEFYCKLTQFTTLVSTQLSILSQNKLLVFNPSVHNYHVSLINTELQALFVLVRTKHRTISYFEKLQHAITAYDQIKKPSKWETWVETQQQNIDNGIITNCQTFMNSAAIKHLYITKKSGFQGSLATKKEDIVAMLSKIKKE